MFTSQAITDTRAAQYIRLSNEAVVSAAGSFSDSQQELNWAAGPSGSSKGSSKTGSHTQCSHNL